MWLAGAGPCGVFVFFFFFCIRPLLCLGLLRLWIAGAGPVFFCCYVFLDAPILSLVGVRAVAVTRDSCGAFMWLSRSADGLL